MSAADGTQGSLARAKQCLKEGRLDEAVAAAREALARDGGSGEAQFTLGVALCRKGLFDEGVVALTAAARESPRSAAVWYNLALAHERIERWPDALAAWHEVLHLDPTSEKARSGVARVGPRAAETPMPAPAAVEDDGLLPMEAAAAPQGAGGFAPWEVGAAQGPPQPPPPSVPAAPPAPTFVGPNAGKHRVEKQYYQEGDTCEWSPEHFLAIITGPGEIIAQQKGYFGFSKPVQFLFWNCVVLCAGSAIIGFLGSLLGNGGGIPFGILGILCSATFLLVCLVVTLLIAAAFYHVFVAMFGGGGGYSVTFRSMALGSVPWVVTSLLSALIHALSPSLDVVANLVALAGVVWSTVVVAVAFRELHEMETTKAVLAAGIPSLAVVVGLAFLLFVVLASAALAARGDAAAAEVSGSAVRLIGWLGR